MRRSRHGRKALQAAANPNGRGCRFTRVSMTTVKLLETAAEIVGGPAELAHRLGIRPATLSLCLADARPLPDALLLKAVDIILEDRQSRLPRLQPPEAQRRDR